jgi:hypothetical protein
MSYDPRDIELWNDDLALDRLLAVIKRAEDDMTRLMEAVAATRCALGDLSAELGELRENDHAADT